MNRLPWILTPSGAMRAWATVLMLIAGFGLALGLTIGYVNKVDRQSARQICGLVVVLDDAYQQQPPQTELGRKVAAEMHAFRVRLGC